MKHLIFKICITGGLLLTGTGFCQTALEDELLLKDGETLMSSDWHSEFAGSQDDQDNLWLKTYGASSGFYYLYLPASGTSPFSNSMISAYSGNGCIYRTSPSGYYDLQLQLPDGHFIKGMRYNFYDSSATTQSSALLQTVDRTGTLITELAIDSTDTTGGYGTVYKTLLQNNTVMNSEYSYSIRFSTTESNNNQQLCGVRLWLDSTP